jgi:hypothetical protein
MLNIKIYSYEEKNEAIKYHKGFLSGEDDLIALALKIYGKEQFDILWDYLDSIEDYIADVARRVMEDSAYRVSVFSYIVLQMRKNEEIYNKFLDYLVEQEYDHQEYFKKEAQKVLKQLEDPACDDLEPFKSETIEKYKKYLNRPDSTFSRESVEVDFLGKYNIIFSLVDGTELTK